MSITIEVADNLHQTPTTDLYRLAEADAECRYPVVVDDDQAIGHVFRWHRDWYAESSAGEHRLGRPPKGKRGADMAAAYLVEEYTAGRITAAPLAQARAETPLLYGPVPLLHPRMPMTPRNIDGARKVMAKLAEYRWTPRGGFPGSDNHWYLICDLCGWAGPKFWSHLRGRNNLPPSAHRHTGGCIGEEKVRQLIAAYQQ